MRLETGNERSFPEAYSIDGSLKNLFFSDIHAFNLVKNERQTVKNKLT